MENTPQPNTSLPPAPQIIPINPPLAAPIPPSTYAPVAPVVAEPIQPANPFFGPANTAAQPVPVVAPVAPIAPIYPATTQVVPADAIIAGVPIPPVKKKISKKIALFIIGGVVLLLAIAAVVFYFVYFNITKEDYQKAATAGTELVTLEAKSRESLQAVTGTATNQPSFKTVEDVTSAVNSATSSLATYETAVKAYDSQKALHNGDVNKLYDAFKKKYSFYTDFSTAYTSAASKAITASTKCSADFKNLADSKSYDEYKKRSDACRAELVSAQSVSDPDWKNLLTAYVNFLDSAAPIYKTIYASSDTKDYTAAYAAIKDLTPVVKTYGDASKAFIASVTDRYKATDGVTASLNAVTDLLNKKAE